MVTPQFFATPNYFWRHSKVSQPPPLQRSGVVTFFALSLKNAKNPTIEFPYIFSVVLTLVNISGIAHIIATIHSTQ